jgi:hypothetical protein
MYIQLFVKEVHDDLFSGKKNSTKYGGFGDFDKLFSRSLFVMILSWNVFEVIAVESQIPSQISESWSQSFLIR